MRKAFGVLEEHRRASHEALGRAETIARLFDGDAAMIASAARAVHRPDNGCRALWCAVIAEAQADLTKLPEDHPDHASAKHFIDSRHFRSICELLGIDALRLRDGMLSGVPKSAPKPKARPGRPKVRVRVYGRTGRPREFESLSEAARALGLDDRYISRAIQRGTRLAGYMFKRCDSAAA